METQQHVHPFKFTSDDKCCFCDNNFRKVDDVRSIPNGTKPETYSFTHQHCLDSQVALAREISKAGGHKNLVMKKELEKVLQTELFKYGFLPMLIVLERMEQLDEFEICTAIVSMLNKHNQEFGIDIPTKYDGMAVAEYKLAFMTQFNLSGEVAYANRDFYADEICLALQNFKKIKK
jgi:hypothetical protein